MAYDEISTESLQYLFLRMWAIWLLVYVAVPGSPTKRHARNFSAFGYFAGGSESGSA